MRNLMASEKSEGSARVTFASSNLTQDGRHFEFIDGEKNMNEVLMDFGIYVALPVVCLWRNLAFNIYE